MFAQFIRHYGNFQELFGKIYDFEDTFEIDEGLYESIFIFNNFEEDLEEDDDTNLENTGNLGETLFSRVTHYTRSRNTRPPQRLADT